MPSWKKVIVSGSDASLNSLNVATNVVAQSFTGSLFGTSSWANNVISSSYALTASYALNGGGGGGSVSDFPYTGSAQITGSLVLTGSLLVTQSYISTVDYIDFTLTADPAHNEGRIHWIDDTKTLNVDTDVNNFYIELGHQNVVRVNNQNSFALTKGTVVYINGENGQRPTVATASFENDALSAATLGLVAQNINSGQNGYVISAGIIRGINTNAYAPGTMLYLSSSGQFSSTIPQSPLHEVRLGKTITQATDGTIFIDVMNGYELGELHDVLINERQNGDLITWNSGSSVFQNTKILSGSYGVSGSLTVSQGITGSLLGTASYATQALSSSYALTASYALGPPPFPYTGSAAITGSLAVTGSTGIKGNLTVSGTLEATIKSFLIDHPTKPGKRLQYGTLEGPEHSVYVRGRLQNGNIIILPDYWNGLIHEDSITVNLTPIGASQNLWVNSITDEYIKIDSDSKNIDCFYSVFAERKDVDKLIVEFDKV